MSKPHVCPVCSGAGQTIAWAGEITAPVQQTCPACNGACVLWEPFSFALPDPVQYPGTTTLPPYDTGTTCATMRPCDSWSWTGV